MWRADTHVWFSGEARPTYCLDCKTHDMIDLGSPGCKCGVARSSFGFSADAQPSCCFKCKSEGMVNLRAPKCVCVCGKSAYYLRSINVSQLTAEGANLLRC
eukprot:TRINITY_DN33567_c0_g1_i1.p1 TRINITY_DN33567_c0_g1~~TRINITY_DN33567_c0_g1_i1.p1  ORF type:complete len:101 (+),score=9.65 TRINITY_DN33567_c0_g1_i1:257-559(+)